MIKVTDDGDAGAAAAPGGVEHAIETYKKQKIVTNILASVQQQCWPQK